MKLIRYICLKEIIRFLLVHLLIFLVLIDARVILKRNIITVERSSNDDIVQNGTNKSPTNKDSIALSLTPGPNSMEFTGKLTTENGNDVSLINTEKNVSTSTVEELFTILPLVNSTKLFLDDNSKAKNNNETIMLITRHASSLQNDKNEPNITLTESNEETTTIKFNDLSTTSNYNEFFLTTIQISEDLTNSDPDLIVVKNVPKKNVNYDDIATNEIRNLTTPTKRGKFMKDDSANTNDLSLPGNVDAWALAGMKDKKHLKIENLGKLSDNNEGKNSTLSVKILTDWTEIMKNVDVFNDTEIKVELNNNNKITNLIESSTQLPFLKFKNQTAEVAPPDVDNKTISEKTSIVMTTKMIPLFNPNVELKPGDKQDTITDGSNVLKVSFQTSTPVLDSASTILKAVHKTLSSVENIETISTSLPSEDTTVTPINLLIKTNTIKDNFAGINLRGIESSDGKQNVQNLTNNEDSKFVYSLKNSNNDTSEKKQNAIQNFITTMATLETTNLPKSTEALSSIQQANNLDNSLTTEKYFSTTEEEFTEVTQNNMISEVSETTTSFSENSHSEAASETTVSPGKINNILIKQSQPVIVEYSTDFEVNMVTSQTDVSETTLNPNVFESTTLVSKPTESSKLLGHVTSSTISSSTTTIKQIITTATPTTTTATTGQPQIDLETTLKIPVQENSIESNAIDRTFESTTKSLEMLTGTQIVTIATSTMSTPITNEYPIDNAVDASTSPTTFTKKEQKYEVNHYTTPSILYYPKFDETTTNNVVVEMTLEPQDQEAVNPEVDPTETDYNVIIAISVSVIGVVALILLVGFLYVMRKRQKQMSYGQRCRPVSLDAYSLDNVSVFNSVRRKGVLRTSKRSYGNVAFDDPSLKHNVLGTHELIKFVEKKTLIADEFKDVPQIIARSDEVPAGCEDKNRYANVVPLPETRVILQQQNGDERTDYINANYVRGPKDTPNYYIATQGPLESTIVDFWRMIWEQNSRVIIMVTDLIENGIEKCAEYLPPSVTLDNHTVYGDFQVTLKNRDVKDKYAVSTLLVKNVTADISREITHFWFKWPETGVPGEEAGVIAMLLEARSSLKAYATEQFEEKDRFVNEKDRSADILKNEITESNGNVVDIRSKSQSKPQGPLTIHCSNGTGRTGTIIACDIAIRSLETPKRIVDVPQIVYYVRRGRASAIQTKEQYEFIYRVSQMYSTKIAGPLNDN